MRTLVDGELRELDGKLRLRGDLLGTLDRLWHHLVDWQHAAYETYAPSTFTYSLLQFLPSVKLGRAYALSIGRGADSSPL